MSFVASSYNYATPLSSAPGLISGTTNVPDNKYFTLFDNTLDGSYYPITGDVGIWSGAVSDESGVLSSTFVLTVTEEASINAFRLVGSQYSYPVSFTVQFYNGDELLYTITEADNSAPEYVHYLDTTLDVTHYTVAIPKISSGGAVVRLYSVGEVGYARRVDPIYVQVSERSSVTTLRVLNLADTLLISDATNRSSIVNTINPTYDTLAVRNTEKPTLTNVHTRMKDPYRHIYGKVYVTYSDPMLDSETTVEANTEAYNSARAQLMDDVKASNELLFTLYDNDLSGRYSVMSDNSQVGWVSGVISNIIGSFVDDAEPFTLGSSVLAHAVLGSEPSIAAGIAPSLKISFFARPVTPLMVHFDDSHGSVAKDFTATFFFNDGTTLQKSFVGNTSAQVLINDTALSDVTGIEIAVTSTTLPYHPVGILEIPIISTLLYEGYADHSDLISIDLLEELTYNDDVEALGGMSANEATIVFDNSDNEFYFNNEQSLISKQLKRNRKVVPWLGVEVVPGTIEWYQQGVFWSYSWNVPVKSLTATVVAFDTIGLLDTTSFEKHLTQVNKSIGDLIDYVLIDAKASLEFLTWSIDPELYNVIIPYAWFEPGSHTKALRKISAAYPMHIYCDRYGTICAAPQKLRLDSYLDTWSDSTNVISKEYSSLYTTLPNIVSVTVHNPLLISNDQLVKDTLIFDVADVPTRTLNFSRPYLADIVVSIDKDDTVSFTYEVYSWGIVLNFTGSGTVQSIVCTGTTVDISNTSVLMRKNAESIKVDGAVTREVSSDFIQTSSLATTIINRIFSLSEYDKYDASVMYRGDIALSINDPIRLLDGIAPDNRYNIRRHQLSWNGALTGTADINT